MAGSMTALDSIKAEVDLREYSQSRYGLQFDHTGKCSCPFHPPDKSPSFSVFKGQDGAWRWKDHHDDQGGTIVDLVARLDGVSDREAIDRVLAEHRPEPAAKPKPEIIREHIYKDASGQPVFKKTKLRTGPKTDWCLYHYDAGTWKPGKNGKDFIPYRLDQFQHYDRVIVCEGEKDSDTVNGLGAGFFATSAPAGCSSWPDSITPHFSRFKEVVFLYDVGNDEHVQKHAAKLRGALPGLAVKIGKVPGTEREFDITDYLGDMEGKADALHAILEQARPYPGPVQAKAEQQPKGVFVGSLEEFMAASIPAPDPLIDPLVYRSGFSMVGGVKGSHKSFFCIQAGLSLASAKPSFLNCRIQRPARVLLVQQEISVSFMQERIERIISAERYETAGRFIPITTTSNQIKLVDPRGIAQLRGWIEQYEPELLILDPISSFHDTQENDSRDQAKIRDVLNRLKARYNMGLLVSHHFTSKRNPNDPMAPTEVGGWFRGHSCLTDAADVLIALHRLPGQHDNPNLPHAYENYNQVQIQLRNGAWPERFAIEFDDETFLLKPSNVWSEFGRKVLPDQIVALLRANGGSMLRKDLVAHFGKNQIGPMSVVKGVNEALNQRLIEEEKLKGPGNPLLFKLKGAA